MNKDETIAILRILKISYPQFYKDMKKEDAEDTISIWTMMFENDEPKIVTEAVKALIITNKFPPTIADVKEKINLITQNESSVMTEMEAWNIVYKSIKYANYGSEQAFNEFPEIIKKLVGSPQQLREWAIMDADTVKSVVQSNFMRSFKVRQTRDLQLQALPESTKKLIQGLSEKLSMPVIGEKTHEAM